MHLQEVRETAPFKSYFLYVDQNQSHWGVLSPQDSPKSRWGHAMMDSFVGETPIACTLGRKVPQTRKGKSVV
ncbi:hypothetical protein VULLAG_LOCUS21904 [Vulpes lagopus]